jgi:predicted DNA-binding ribbon-helix-helix protein
MITRNDAKRDGPGVIIKHSLTIAGHRTSVSLEQVFWQALKSLADNRGVSLAALIAEVDAGRGEANLSSAIRVFVLKSVRNAATASAP